MVISRRTLTLAVVALVLAVATAASIPVLGAWESERDTDGQRLRANPRGRRDLLNDLVVRLIPSTAGGFVVSTPSNEPDLPVWVMAAALDPSGTDAVRDRALQAAALLLRGDDLDDARSAALSAAQALRVINEPLTAAHERLADEILHRTRSELHSGHGDWLAPLLQLATGPSRAALRAGAMVSAYAAHPTCGRLKEARSTSAQPQRELTVLLAALVVQGDACEGAEPLLDRLLREPAWRSPIAGYDLLDLARLAPQLSRATKRRLEETMTAWLDRSDGSVVDPGSVMLAREGARLFGLQIEVPDAVQRHIAGQARLRGALADRSSAPPTAFDVVILRQLVAEGLVSQGELTATAQAVEPPGPSRDSVVTDDLLMRGELPSCSQAAKAPPKGPKVTLPWLIASEVQQVVRKECEGSIDVPALMDRARRRSHNYDEAPRVLAVVLAACHLWRESLTDAAGGTLKGGGPFANESFTLMGAAAGLDPVGTCAAELGG